MKLEKMFLAKKIQLIKKEYLFLMALVFGLLVTSCQDVKRPQMPANLIAQDTMVSILVDAYMMNAARSIDNRTLVNKGVLLDSILYTKHRIDSLQFAQSNAYYASDLDVYKKLFLKVQEELKIEKTKKDTLYAQYKRAKELQRINDSVKGARLDSLQGIYPKIKRDSIEQLLKLVLQKNTIQITKPSKK
ncbi:DUF4296 domain-containing protein [Flavobacteriaceae bacterium]|nr:DUF4296 domain-containing protein [Flavobacteriaceae bacterium]